jgi:ribosomal protein S18 acetylase RimI-like enzyme
MNFSYGHGNIDDLNNLKSLALKSWKQFQSKLTKENWDKLYNSLNDDKTYTDLLNKAICMTCACKKDKIIGMAFLVPSGNPTEIYDKSWSYIRFISVDPEFGGQGIGRQLTIKCIESAKANGEQTIALHTSELMNNARHIYESLGFKILKEIDQRFGKRYWLYTLELSDNGEK